MKRKLTIATLGIVSLGLNSLVIKPVFSQSTPQYWTYNCYFEDTGELFGYTQTFGPNPELQLATEQCNFEIPKCNSPYYCVAKLQEKPTPAMSLDTLPSSLQ